MMRPIPVEKRTQAKAIGSFSKPTRSHTTVDCRPIMEPVNRMCICYIH